MPTERLLDIDDFHTRALTERRRPVPGRLPTADHQPSIPIMSVSSLDTTDRSETTDPTDFESPIDDRDRRALLEALLVEPLAPGMYHVYSEQGVEYVVDIETGACTCPDFRYREVECKHLRRARLEAGETDTGALAERIDAELDAVDERLGALAARRAALVRLQGALTRFE